MVGHSNMRKLLIYLMVAVIALVPTLSFARGGGGGGHASSGGRSSFSSSRSSSSLGSSRASSSARVSTPSRPSAPRVSSKPSSSTAKVTQAKPKVVGGKSYGKTGSVVSSTYQPRFRGYTAPIGSTVYYRESSALDWLPFYMIMTSQSHREAVVSTPATATTPVSEVVVKEEGLDGMYIWNWIFSVLIGLGLIAWIVYLVNKRSNKYA